MAGFFNNKANNKHNQEKKDSVASASDTGRNIKISSISIKIENLSKTKKLNFVNANFFETDFFTFKAKKAFAYL